MHDTILLATAKRRADDIAQHVKPGWFVMVHWPDLHAAAHFSSDGAGAVGLQVNRKGRAAFERIVREATGAPAPEWVDCLALPIETEGSA